jgi:phosphatidate cytidylyltransferase
MDARLLWTTEGLFGVGAVLMAACHARRRPDARVQRLDWVKLAVYFLFIHALLGAGALGRPFAAALFALAVVAGTAESLALGARLPGFLPALPAALLALGLAHALAAPGAVWFPSFAFLVLVVASTDSFAQLSGRLWGRRHPFPRWSPNKTVEGVVGGMTAAMIVALSCGFLTPGLPMSRRVLLAALTSAAGIAGDLLFSTVKRRAGIKDFSALLPGHGGILDRFDSMAIAAPAYVWARTLLLG